MILYTIKRPQTVLPFSVDAYWTQICNKRKSANANQTAYSRQLIKAVSNGNMKNKIISKFFFFIIAVNYFCNLYSVKRVIAIIITYNILLGLFLQPTLIHTSI